MRYNIKKGDTLSGIAKRFGTSWSKLAKDNKIMNPDRIQAGSSIIVPSMDRPNMEAQVIKAKEKQPLTRVKDQLVDARQQAKIMRSQEDLGRRPQEKGINFSLFPQAQAMPKKETQMSYKVQKGDTFNAIAKRNNMTPDQLAELNKGIKNRSKISVGQNIKLKDDRGFFGRASDYLFGEDEPTKKSIMSKPERNEPIVPTNIRQLVYDVFGGENTLTEKDLKTSEIDALRSAVKSAQKRGSSAIEYEDYGTQEEGGNQYSDVSAVGSNKSFLSKLGDASYSMKTLIGQGGITKNEKGETIILDRYNFNNAVDGSFWDYLKDARSAGSSLYAQARTIGKHFGSGEGEGSPVAINLGVI
jgi:LysM repeat protein|tara:strand:+ start:600 stop:1670 length:1071 start_codon:yes stop_codon:yes gene_type:complete